MRTNSSSSVRHVLPTQRPRRFGLWLLGPVVAALALGGASISAAHAQAVGSQWAGTCGNCTSFIQAHSCKCL